MAYNDDKWVKAKTLYEAGLSLSQIKDRTGIARNTISQKAKKEQWESGANSDYIEAKEIIALKKGTKTEQEISILDDIAAERTKHLIYFQGSALRNQRKANKMLEDAEALHEVEAHSRITQRNKEIVLGRDKAIEINNTNAQTNETKTIEFNRIEVKQ